MEHTRCMYTQTGGRHHVFSDDRGGCREPITPYGGNAKRSLLFSRGTIAAHVQKARRADQLRLYAARDALISLDDASQPILPGLDTHRLTPADWRNRPVPYKLTT